MTYRLEIDRSICSAFGACAELAPDQFEVGPDGIAKIRVGESDDPAVIDAADACPMGAISVVELADRAA
jgi:ferredoxin